MKRGKPQRHVFHVRTITADWSYRNEKSQNFRYQNHSDNRRRVTAAKRCYINSPRRENKPILDTWHALHSSVTDPAWIPDAKSHGDVNKL